MTAAKTPKSSPKAASATAAAKPAEPGRISADEELDLAYALEADLRAQLADAHRQIEALNDRVFQLGQEVITLYGQISDGITKELRLTATRWLAQLRSYAQAVKDLF